MHFRPIFTNVLFKKVVFRSAGPVQQRVNTTSRSPPARSRLNNAEHTVKKRAGTWKSHEKSWNTCFSFLFARMDLRGISKCPSFFGPFLLRPSLPRGLGAVGRAIAQ